MKKGTEKCLFCGGELGEHYLTVLDEKRLGWMCQKCFERAKVILPKVIEG